MAEAQFVKAPGFDKSFKLQVKRDPSIKKKMATFVGAKRSRPPQALPPGFKDHRLSGALGKFSEVHLGRDSLLIYTDTAGTVTLYRVVSHSDISGPKQQSLAGML